MHLKTDLKDYRGMVTEKVFSNKLIAKTFFELRSRFREFSNFHAQFYEIGVVRYVIKLLYNSSFTKRR